MPPLSPRELYLVFREVIGHLVMSSGEGASLTYVVMKLEYVL